MDEFFRIIKRTLREFGEGDRHQMRLFAAAFLICLFCEWSMNLTVGIFIAVVTGPLFEAMHAYCSQRRVKMLWWYVDIPDLERLCRDIGDAMDNTFRLIPLDESPYHRRKRFKVHAYRQDNYRFTLAGCAGYWLLRTTVVALYCVFVN